MISLDSPITAVVGGSAVKRDKMVEKLGLRTVGDLLRHFPRRYVETAVLGNVPLHVGARVFVVGEISRGDVRTYRDKRTGRPAARYEAVLATATEPLRMTFFAKNEGMAVHFAKKFRPGTRGLFTGEIGRFGGQWQLTNPAHDLFGRDANGDEGVAALPIPPLYPIYPLTKGVDHWDLQRATAFALTVLEDPPELLPASTREEYAVISARTAYEWAHGPADHAQASQARRRFRFEEALVTQLVLARRRRAQRSLGARARDGGDGRLLAAFDAALPFELTGGQRETGAEIDADLVRAYPMNRLLQGEVGSGKTLVALRAMLRVVDSGGQAALLAPTEVLAQQHYRSITALLGELAQGGMLGGSDIGTQVELLTGSMTKTQRTAPLSRLATGEAGLVVGTHALLEDTVMFDDLGLVVVDEQHRFGVEQRAALTGKAIVPPHVLVMTATPIPRTVAMTVFGDLEVSTLRELPAGRAEITTNVVNTSDHPTWIDRVWERVREEVAAGHQVYVVCPRITGDETEQGTQEILDALDPDVPPAEEGDRPPPPPPAAVEEVVEQLRAGALAGLQVGALHGRMPGEQKEATMRAFADGAIDVLVATTVIEVGVDVHNATAMVILDADRFGVSQLHQLRGRVGRGGLPGLCLLVSHVDLLAPPGARERLDAVAATTDGFELSQVDLEQRREGDVLGSSQSGGRSTLVNLRVLRDETTITQARAAAETLLDADESLLSTPELEAEVLALESAAAGYFIEKS